MPTELGFGEYDLVAFIATTDGVAAKRFYGEALGLRLVSEDDFALVFDAHGTMLRVVNVPQFGAAPYTVLGWRVPDISAAIRQLVQAGAKLERYEGMVQDASGIWTSPTGARVAWFKDPAGNTLSVSQ
jgi:predicted enzyme related to lactoylglutathione lyase